MKKQSLILNSALAAIMASTNASAELSANVGVVSDYIFRGITQTSTAAANGGVDYEDASGIYAGVWATNIEGNAGTGGSGGLEIDTYIGYGGEMDGVSYSIGFTHYEYTGDFDTSYDEINLGAGFGDVSVDVAIGSNDNPGGTDPEYLFYSLGYATGPFSVSYNGWGQDFDGEYLEFGMSTDIGGADAGVSVIMPLADANDNVDIDTKSTMVFSISKGFEL